jgi:exonuclease SbcD
VDGKDWIAYSGTPLPYSFSEEAQKSVRIVDIGAEGFQNARTIDVPLGRKVKVLTDTMDGLLSKPLYDQYRDYWVSVKLMDQTVQEQPVERLRPRFPHLASLGYANVRQSGAGGPQSGSIADLRRDPHDVIIDYVQDMHRREAAAHERELIVNMLNAIESTNSQ